RIDDTRDALIILEACRQGLLPRINRRLLAAERERQDMRSESLVSPSDASSSGATHTRTMTTNLSLIESGSVFVFDEDESGICRWTDGRIWSPSRICGNFLVYRELYRKLPDQKCLTAREKAVMKNGSGLKDKALKDAVRKDNLVVMGCMKGTFVLKKDGLIKKTICVRGVELLSPEEMKQRSSSSSSSSTRGRTTKENLNRPPGFKLAGIQHLVCYERPGAMRRLHTPREYVQLRDLPLSKTFILMQKYRAPIRVTPLRSSQQPIEPSDEYIGSERVTESRNPAQPVKKAKRIKVACNDVLDDETFHETDSDHGEQDKGRRNVECGVSAGLRYSTRSHSSRRNEQDSLDITAESSYRPRRKAARQPVKATSPMMLRLRRQPSQRIHHATDFEDGSDIDVKDSVCSQVTHVSCPVAQDTASVASKASTLKVHGVKSKDGHWELVPPPTDHPAFGLGYCPTSASIQSSSHESEELQCNEHENAWRTVSTPGLAEASTRPGPCDTLSSSGQLRRPDEEGEAVGHKRTLTIAQIELEAKIEEESPEVQLVSNGHSPSTLSSPLHSERSCGLSLSSSLSLSPGASLSPIESPRGGPLKGDRDLLVQEYEHDDDSTDPAIASAAMILSSGLSENQLVEKADSMRAMIPAGPFMPVSQDDWRGHSNPMKSCMSFSEQASSSLVMPSTPILPSSVPMWQYGIDRQRLDGFQPNAPSTAIPTWTSTTITAEGRQDPPSLGMSFVHNNGDRFGIHQYHSQQQQLGADNTQLQFHYLRPHFVPAMPSEFYRSAILARETNHVDTTRGHYGGISGCQMQHGEDNAFSSDASYDKKEFHPTPFRHWSHHTGGASLTALSEGEVDADVDVDVDVDADAGSCGSSDESIGHSANGGQGALRPCLLATTDELSSSFAEHGSIYDPRLSQKQLVVDDPHAPIEPANTNAQGMRQSSPSVLYWDRIHPLVGMPDPTVYSNSTLQTPLPMHSPPAAASSLISRPTPCPSKDPILPQQRMHRRQYMMPSNYLFSDAGRTTSSDPVMFSGSYPNTSGSIGFTSTPYILQAFTTRMGDTNGVNLPQFAAATRQSSVLIDSMASENSYSLHGRVSVDAEVCDRSETCVQESYGRGDESVEGEYVFSHEALEVGFGSPDMADETRSHADSDPERLEIGVHVTAVPRLTPGTLSALRPSGMDDGAGSTAEDLCMSTDESLGQAEYLLHPQYSRLSQFSEVPGSDVIGELGRERRSDRFSDEHQPWALRQEDAAQDMFPGLMDLRPRSMFGSSYDQLQAGPEQQEFLEDKLERSRSAMAMLKNTVQGQGRREGDGEDMRSETDLRSDDLSFYSPIAE
ncbi:hypothetical protein BGX28_007913, partial [Mortierella sp. GBA30]